MKKIEICLLIEDISPEREKAIIDQILERMKNDAMYAGVINDFSLRVITEYALMERVPDVPHRDAEHVLVVKPVKP